MNLDFSAAWQALIHHPLFGLGITLAVYQLAVIAYERTRWIFLQPVLFSMVVLVALLLLSGLDYGEYSASVSPLILLLGPSTVALAVPLYLNLRRIRQLLVPILVTCWSPGCSPPSPACCWPGCWVPSGWC